MSNIVNLNKTPEAILTVAVGTHVLLDNREFIIGSQKGFDQQKIFLTAVDSIGFKDPNAPGTYTDVWIHVRDSTRSGLFDADEAEMSRQYLLDRLIRKQYYIDSAPAASILSPNDRTKMTVTFEVTAAQALALQSMFNHWNYLAAVGSSRMIGFFVDGCGNFKPHCDVKFQHQLPELTQELQTAAVCTPVDSSGNINFDFDAIAWKLRRPGDN